MLQQDTPDDFVLATGKTHSVREFVCEAFSLAGYTLTWSGSGTNEIATDQTGRVVIRVNPEFYRPADVDILIGDASTALDVLGWKPTTSFKELVAKMVAHDTT
jgi:GDPmannose 4,6-dehydratase